MLCLFLCLFARAELPAPGTPDTSYMEQFSGALRRSHPSADPVLVDVLVDIPTQSEKVSQSVPGLPLGHELEDHPLRFC